MLDALVFSFSLTAIASILFIACRGFDARVSIGMALLAALYVGLDDFLTGLPTVVSSLAVIGDRWNWMGKLLSLVLAGVTMLALQLTAETVGLELEQRHPRIGIAALLLFVVWGTCLGLWFQPGAPTAETLAFQATMPGLAEELAYRGIAPAILFGLLCGKAPVNGTPWAIIIALSILFGVWHGLRYMDGRFGFDIWSAFAPTLGGVAGGWLRFKTGSLVVPILGHGLANVAFHLAGGIAA